PKRPGHGAIPLGRGAGAARKGEGGGEVRGGLGKARGRHDPGWEHSGVLGGGGGRGGLGGLLRGQHRWNGEQNANSRRESHISSFPWRSGIICGRPSNDAIETGQANTRSTVSRVRTSAGAPSPAGRPSASRSTRSANRAARFTW